MMRAGVVMVVKLLRNSEVSSNIFHSWRALKTASTLDEFIKIYTLLGEQLLRLFCCLNLAFGSEATRLAAFVLNDFDPSEK